MFEYDGTAPSEPQRFAVKHGMEAMGVDSETLSVRFTSNFDATIRDLTGFVAYASDRGTGTVAAKTLQLGDAPVVVFNTTAIENVDISLLERTAAHEAGHVLIYSGQADHGKHSRAVQSEWQSYLVDIAGTAIEEYRVEKSLSEIGYPASGASDADHIATVLHWTNADLLELLLDPASADPRHLCRGVIDQADRLSKVLAYTTAYGLNRDYSNYLAPQGQPAVAGWHDYVEPTWSRRITLYSSLPSAFSVLSIEDWQQCLVMGLELEHDLVRSLGFTFRNLPQGGWGFFTELGNEGWYSRAQRLQEQEDLYDAGAS